MCGYPYHNDDRYLEPELLLTDLVNVQNAKIFALGFFLGVTTRIRPVIANDYVDYVPKPALAGNTSAPMPAPVPGQTPASMPTRAKRIQALALFSACGATSKCGVELIKKGTERTAESIVHSAPAAAAAIGCIFVAGWCIGRSFDKYVEINFG